MENSSPPSLTWLEFKRFCPSAATSLELLNEDLGFDIDDEELGGICIKTGKYYPIVDGIWEQRPIRGPSYFWLPFSNEWVLEDHLKDSQRELIYGVKIGDEKIFKFTSDEVRVLKYIVDKDLFDLLALDEADRPRDWKPEVAMNRRLLSKLEGGGVDEVVGDCPCPGCGCKPGDGITESCDHPDGCGYSKFCRDGK